MVNLSWLALAAANILAAEALVARNITTANPVDIAAIVNQVITEIKVITDHTTEVQTDFTTLTQTAYVITTGFPVEGTKTVTQTVLAYTAPPHPDPSPYTVEILNGEEQTTSTFPIPDAPHATLQPAVSFNTDVHDLANLVPTDNHALYYTPDGVADPNLDHTFAILNVNHSTLAVVLEHSAYVQSVSCQSTGLIVNFTTTEALNTAKGSWPAAGEFIIVSHTSGCNSTPADEVAVRSFFAVSGVTFIDLAAIVTAVEVAIENAIHEATLEWGTYTASNSTTPIVPTPTAGDIFASALPTPTGGNGSGCGIPPAAQISGFPTAPCGDTFDKTLDREIGFLSFDDASFSSSLESIAPGLGDYSLDDYDVDEVSAPSRFRRRKFSLNPVKLVKKVAAKGIKIIKSAPAAVKAVVAKGVQVAKAGIKAVAEVISNLLSPSIKSKVNINIGPKDLVDTPFGPSFQIFKTEKQSKGGAASGSIGLYCVKCGVTGVVNIQGKLAFSITQAKITEGSLGFNGNIKAGIGIGLVAEASYDKTFTKPITSVGVPGFSIPNIVTIGPVLALDVDLNIKIEAIGTVLAGAELTIDAFAANIDIVDSSKSFTSGFTPKIQTYFNVTGEITASANLGVPLTVGVGIDIVPLGKAGRRLVAIKNRAGIQATAKYEYSNTNPGECNNGISYGIGVTEDVSLDLFGLKSVPLFSYAPPNFVSKCYLFGGKPTPVAEIDSATSTDATEATTTEETAQPTTSDAQITPTETSGVVPTETPEALDSTGTGSLSPTSEVTPSATPDPTLIPKLRYNRQVTPTTDDAVQTLTAAVDSSPSNEAFAQLEALAASNEDTIAAQANSTEGLNYVKIKDSTGSYYLVAGDDGNFNVLDAAAVTVEATFALFEDVIVSDYTDRLMHYHPDTMKAFGVSRLRLSSDDEFPVNADIINLVPLDYDDSQSTSGVFVAVDTMGDYFYTAICNLEGQASKIFLVSDPSESAGLAKLQDPDLRYIVTGGVVTDCQYIAFLSNMAGY